jgi:hypothetical protein
VKEVVSSTVREVPLSRRESVGEERRRVQRRRFRREESLLEEGVSQYTKGKKEKEEENAP